ncbi:MULTISPECIES: hypothetical protein [unclassified Paenibacillus]|uniref:hypothetical protein n=1 Tax=unclassified Paenibacillus TaxID=185978 RepID=UPI00034E6F83|nr:MULTISPECIES: hypothetical protein [unclassified Paenibacillus]EPD80495.1 hypothetical protein HMPREF1207_05668 [Paenibacillus sp. HGH0039]
MSILGYALVVYLIIGFLIAVGITCYLVYKNRTDGMKITAEPNISLFIMAPFAFLYITFFWAFGIKFTNLD